MKFLNRILLAVALTVCFNLALAQPQGSIYVIAPSKNVTVRTITAQTTGTVNSADQAGFGIKTVSCSFNMSTFTGAPSSTFTIQNKDPASGIYYTIATSTAVTAVSLPAVISAGVGLANVASTTAAIPINTFWRVASTVGGSSTPIVTGTISCVIAN